MTRLEVVPDFEYSQRMRHPVKRFKSMAIALKELEPFVRDPAQLESGRPFKRFGDVRPREAFVNWLLCAVANFTCNADRFIPTSDPTGGDGLIYDSTDKVGRPTEHVMVRVTDTNPEEDLHDLIIEAIEKKQAKGGEAYAAGKALVVYVFGGSGRKWFPDRAAGALPEPLLFERVWVVCLESADDDAYVFGATRLDWVHGNAPVYFVRIPQDFGRWEVSEVQ